MAQVTRWLAVVVTGVSTFMGQAKNLDPTELTADTGLRNVPGIPNRSQGDTPVAFRLPQPTGMYAVGTTSFFVNRKAAGLPRPLLVTAWYPAGDTVGRERSFYLREEAALRRMASWGENPAAAVLAQANTVTHSWLDATVATTRRSWPVLLFSHGYLAMASDYTALMEDLASHGYAVFSVTHTGETMALTLPNGDTDAVLDSGNSLVPLVGAVVSEWGAEDSVAATVTSMGDPKRAEAALRGYLNSIPRSTEALERWIGDTRAVVDELVALTRGRIPSRFARRLDLNRIAALGHSMGGVTAAAYCARDIRCRASVNLDGSPQYGDLIDHPTPKPHLMVYSARAGRVGVSDLIYRRGGNYLRAVLSGSLHLNFGDWQYWEGPERQEAGLGTISPARSTRVVHQLLIEYFAVQFHRQRSPLLEGTATYPELSLTRVLPVRR